ncbi:MAG TPA: hypothetical protein VHS76_12065 [Steroidobacteraceae bacterium]|nr:hypothetical protein [Steroidobacteraceae bacterium]
MRLSLRGFLILFLVSALLTTGALILLPHDKYLRYQSLNDRSAPNSYWIYERIHDDPTPIDIAFIGTSRTGRSINTERLQNDLAAYGIHTHAVNFHIVKTGRNMHYVIAKELLEHRAVKLLVLEITEVEDRKPHPDFIFLADTSDVLSAPLFINTQYFSDLARLPGRQLDLFLDTKLQRSGLRTPDFVPPPYEGPNLDRTEYLLTLDGVKHSLAGEHTLAEMETMRVSHDADATPPVLPPSLAWLEYRMSRYYIDGIFDLAARNGTRIALLYLPRFGGPAVPDPYRLYAKRAPLINPAAAVQNFRLWSDETHVNAQGSRAVTDAVAEALRRAGNIQ